MGWRARIGIIWPADGVRDAELWKFLPEGVSLHVTRTGLTGDETTGITVDSLLADVQRPDLYVAARILATIHLDSIAYLCTSASFVGGPGSDRDICERLYEATGVAATTTSTAMIEGLQALQVRRVAAVAPYPKEITERLESFLTGNGFVVVRWDTLGLERGTDIGEVTPAQVYRLVREVDHPDAEAIFISCTNLPTIEIIEALEQDLGKPVLSANQVSMWHSLSLAGVRAPMTGTGQLFQVYPLSTRA